MISIHARIGLSLLIGSALIFGAGGWWLDRHVRDTFELQHDAALVSRAWALANALQADDGKIELEALHGITAALQASSRPLYFEVWHSDGSLAGRSPTLAGHDLPRIANDGDEARVIDVTLPPDGRAGRAAGIRMDLYEEREAVEAPEPTLDNPVVTPSTQSPVDQLTIVVAEDLRDLNEAMSSLRQSVIAFAALSFLLSALYVGWSLRRGLAPLNELAERARALEPQSLHLGIGRGALPRELVPVRDRMNELLARVQHALEHEQRFTAGLAHELRTPVAELRMLAEVALRQRDPAPDRRLQEDVLAVSRRMQAVIESLLALRRAETDAESIELGPVLLDEVLAELLAEHASRARVKRVQCSCRVDAETIVHSNEALLRAILGNLLSNAIEYCPPDTRVTVAVVSNGDHLTVTFKNSAPGLATHDVARMFEPFWRKDGAGSNAAHAGIGLSLARSLARALGGELSGELYDNGDLSIRLTGLQRSRG